MASEEVLAAAQAEIFNPYRHDGIGFLQAPDWTWKTAPAPRVAAFAASDYPEQMAVLTRDIKQVNTHKTRHAVLYNHSAILVDAANVSDGLKIDKRTLSMFRKKMRIRTTYRAAMADYLAQEQTSYAGLEPVLPQAAPPDTDAVYRIPMPGLGNYFHTVWENLPQLIPLQEAGFRGKIYIPSPFESVPKFFDGFVDLLFPDLRDGIVLDTFQTGMGSNHTRDHTQFYTGFDWTFYAQLVPGADVDIGLPQVLQDDPKFDLYNRSNAFGFFFSFANSYTINQQKFRQRALDAIAGFDASHLPKRFWISRQGNHRRPGIGNEAALLDALRPYGFEEVRLETLSVTEQIALFHQAEIVVGQHGAGFTNLLFSGPQTTAIELGQGQTLERWRAFHPLSALSGCTYETVLCDYDNDTPTKRPNIKLDGFPEPRVGTAAIDQILERVENALG